MFFMPAMILFAAKPSACPRSRSLFTAICAAASLLTAPCLPAQQPAPPPAAPTKLPHSLRLMCVDVVPVANRLVIAEKTDKGWLARWRLGVASQSLTEPVGFATRTLGLAVDPSPPPVKSGFLGPAAPVKEPLPVTPFAEFHAPDSPSAIVLLVAAPAANAAKVPYRVVVLDTDTTRFAAGQILVRNFAPKFVACVFGAKTEKIAPGESALVSPKSNKEGNMVQVTLALQNGESWEPFCDTRWQAAVPYRRYLLLLPRGDGSIHPFVMPEYPPFR